MTDIVDDAKVMRIWRECGLPEYFLGNGGSNHKLVAFAKACAADEIERLRDGNLLREIANLHVKIGSLKTEIERLRAFLNSKPSKTKTIYLR